MFNHSFPCTCTLVVIMLACALSGRLGYVAVACDFVQSFHLPFCKIMHFDSKHLG